MSYGENPNKTRKSDSGEFSPEYPVIWLNMGPYAIWWTGPITGVPYGDDCFAWIAPILVNSPTSPAMVDYMGARPIEAVEVWEGTMWASRPDGPAWTEIVRIQDEVRSFTLLASKFRGELR